jgi:hypothetical protein
VNPHAEAADIVVAVVRQESGLRNLGYGDRDFPLGCSSNDLLRA